MILAVTIIYSEIIVPSSSLNKCKNFLHSLQSYIIWLISFSHSSQSKIPTSRVNDICKTNPRNFSKYSETMHLYYVSLLMPVRTAVLEGISVQQLHNSKRLNKNDVHCNNIAVKSNESWLPYCSFPLNINSYLTEEDKFRETSTFFSWSDLGCINPLLTLLNG